MAVRLTLPKEPYWIDLGYGCRHKVRPATTALTASLQAKAERLARQMTEPAEAERLAGIVDAKDLTDEDLRTGLFHLYLAILVAQAVTVEWAGYEDDAGALPPVTDDNVAAAMRLPFMAKAFIAAYFAPYEAMAEEGKD